VECSISERRDLDETNDIDKIHQRSLEPYQAKKTSTWTPPLPERLRPKSADEFVGQEELLAKGSLLRNLIDKVGVP
jgi:replication-associated recombination protein RarA